MIGCKRAIVLLLGRASGLSDAERLRLEQHLDGCERCRREALELDRLVQPALGSALPALSQRARHRIVAGALSALDSPRAPAPVAARPRRQLWVPMGLAASLAVVTTLILLSHSHSPSTQPARVVESTAPTPRAPDDPSSSSPAEPANRDELAIAEVVTAGTIEVAGIALSIGAAVPADAPMRAKDAAALQVADAVLSLRRGSVLRWNPSEREARLEKGAVRVEAAQAVRVATKRFRVELSGADSTIGQRSVHVHEGSARVFAADGTVLAAQVVAGESWELPAPRRKAEERGAPANVASEVEARLLQARELLATGQIEEARAAVRETQRIARTSRQRAEAETLLAECAMVAGQSGAAIQLYIRVSERYSGSPAAENALFAAARLAASSGMTSRARELLERYLERYPQGRLRSEAKRRLERLR